MKTDELIDFLESLSKSVDTKKLAHDIASELRARIYGTDFRDGHGDIDRIHFSCKPDSLPYNSCETKINDSCRVQYGYDDGLSDDSFALIEILK